MFLYDRMHYFELDRSFDLDPEQYERFMLQAHELEKLLSEAGFPEYEHLDADETTETFFQDYNRSNQEHCMRAPAGVGYCLAVKR